MLCVSLVSEISVPAPKILVRGEAESERLESEALQRMQLLKRECSSTSSGMDLSRQRRYGCSILPGSGLQAAPRGYLVLMEVCALFLLLDSLCRGALGFNYERRKLWGGFGIDN
jgi:hypothetical protein